MELQDIATNSEDAKEILETIAKKYSTTSAPARYNLIQAFLAIKQEASESSSQFISRTRKALHLIQAARPALAVVASTTIGTSSGYSVADFDEELLLGVLLNGTRYPH